MRIVNLTNRKIRILKTDGTIMELKPEKTKLKFKRILKEYKIENGIWIGAEKKEYIDGLNELKKIINYYADNYDIVILPRKIAEYILFKHITGILRIKNIDNIFYPWMYSKIEKNGKKIEIVRALCPINGKY